METRLPGERLEAPGILKNPPLVEALYDPEASFEHTLQNLLERKGYAGLDAVRAEGEARGKAEGLRAAVLDLCEAFGLEPTGEQRARLEAMGVGELEALRRQVKQTRSWPA
ncbi:MAG TPA: hypothetical protein VFS43_28140 [Polyangiaceae bacterium]|nr:hypothetical protein [Polyangiaceae bacterium]